jgi:hypothetical protein
MYDPSGRTVAGWIYYKDQMPPHDTSLVLFTEELVQDTENIRVALGYADVVHDHILADLKQFGKDGLRFRFWRPVPLPPTLAEKYALVREGPARCI